jgi:hypothetical protein
VGDHIIAYQTDRNELVGLALVKQFRKRGKHRDVVLQPIRDIRAKVRPLKSQDAKISAIPALQPGPIKTIYDISTADAERLLAASVPNYYIVNTNTQSSRVNGHEYMLHDQRAAAFYHPWNREIDRIKENDIVFLYQSGVGVVAAGRASGQIDIKPCGHGSYRKRNGEHSMKLLDFKRVDPPIPANVISAISEYAEGTGVVLRRTVVHLRPGAGLRLHRLAALDT